MSPRRVLGVVGAGTMGAGIAQAGVLADAEVYLRDPVPEALERGMQQARAGLAKWIEKGTVPAGAQDRLHAAPVLSDLADCDLVIEAAPESLDLKQRLFAELAEVAPRAVLASNTSSIPITSIAAAVPDPSRVVGMHFFNPAPLMRLVEVIAGVDSSPEALAVAREMGEAMRKRVIDATDGPGFLVNRCNRPFGLESLRLLQDGLAGVEQIDAIVRAAGFRMGPFELQDLVGIDVGFEVAKSFHELSFGEPRWQPSPLTAKLVAAGHLGRKSGRGWYAYPEGGGAYREDDPPAPPAGGGDGRLVVIAGDLMLAHALRDAADDAGWEVAEEPTGDVPFLNVDCGHLVGESEPLQGAPQALLVADASLHQLDPSGSAVGFHALAPLSGMVELTRAANTADVAAERAQALFTSLGQRVAWVGDAPGLVLGRIVAQLVNEAAFALQQGVTDEAAALDDGMVLGMNHPRGPLAWADETGLDHVLMILDGLRAELGEERYRAAPLLRRLVSEGRLGIGVGAGFHDYADDDPVAG